MAVTRCLRVGSHHAWRGLLGRSLLMHRKCAISRERDSDTGGDHDDDKLEWWCGRGSARTSGVWTVASGVPQVCSSRDHHLEPVYEDST